MNQAPLILVNLKKKHFILKKIFFSKIFLENIALGNETNKKKKINHFAESSSSTLKEIDIEANYFKKKLKILNISKKNKLVDLFEIQVLKLYEFLIKK